MAYISDGGDGGVVAPSVSVSPTTVVQGNPIRATFTGFAAYTTVQVNVLNGDSQTIYSDATGSGTVTLSITTSQTPGTNYVYATDVSGGDQWGATSASVSFQVAASGSSSTISPAITLSPASVAQGQSVTIKGTGFTHGGGVTLCIQSFSVGGTKAGNDGTFSASLLVGNNVTVGSQPVWVQDTATGKDSNVLTLSVTSTGGAPPVVIVPPASQGWTGSIKSVTGLENAVNTGSAVNVTVHLYAEWNTGLSAGLTWEYSVEIKSSAGSVLASKAWTNIRAPWDTSDSVDEFKSVSFKAPATSDYLTINLYAREAIIGRAQNLLNTKTVYMTVSGGAPAPVPGPVVTPPVSGQVTLTMVVSPTNSGAVTPTPGVHTYNSGTLVVVTATAGSGYSFINWTQGGEVVYDTASMTSINVNQNITLTAHFVSAAPVPPPPTPTPTPTVQAWLSKYGIYAGAGVLALILLLLPSGKKDTVIVVPGKGEK